MYIVISYPTEWRRAGLLCLYRQALPTCCCRRGSKCGSLSCVFVSEETSKVAFPAKRKCAFTLYVLYRSAMKTTVSSCDVYSRSIRRRFRGGFVETIFAGSQRGWRSIANALNIIAVTLHSSRGALPHRRRELSEPQEFVVIVNDGKQAQQITVYSHFYPVY